jgi:methionine-rich copper-binding protein CopC
VAVIEEYAMNKLLQFIVAAAAATCLPDAVWAHALLDHATPGVGTTVQGSPGELTLHFTEHLVAAFSGASLATEGGEAIPTGKAAIESSDPATLHVPIGRKLKPGTYIVHWHAVSVDTHRTSGTYKFTVTP